MFSNSWFTKAVRCGQKEDGKMWIFSFVPGLGIGPIALSAPATRDACACSWWINLGR